MASNSTPVFGLNQWLAEDAVLREDFNADNQKLEQALSLLGNCRVVSGSYVGTGQVGPDAPCRLELGFKPMILFLNTAGGTNNYATVCWFAPIEQPYSGTPYYTRHVTWDDTGVSWYLTALNPSENTPEFQFNEEGHTYTYTALGYKV